ncbi:MAG: hypothetical protein HQ589_03090 [Syntrophaceae bacterium]|nr:hypothetical protein [Syntrophaceae bacterium]
MANTTKAAAKGKSGIQKYAFAGHNKIAAYAPYLFSLKAIPNRQDSDG